MGLRASLGLRQRDYSKSLRRATGTYSGERAGEALERFLAYQDVRNILDIGSGDGEHARIMRAAGKTVTCLSLIPPADVLGDYMTYEVTQQLDGLWASHVLEHQPNPNLFLKKCFNDLRSGGVLAVTVPPLKHKIVGGHLALWNPGMLLYHLILAGFDCRKARLASYGYNISALVRKEPADLPSDLHYDGGDIDKLAHLFPVPVSHGFDGRINDVNW